ncbi:Hint domain-containing protein [Paracoccus pacificus]|uniref:Hint domain-containing protein n=1 Tax=Paracoccus pacificus TaxID=1463598 RepID=A0ABW4R531_9RHOB
MTQGRLSNAIYIGKFSDLDRVAEPGTPNGRIDNPATLINKPFNLATQPGMEIRNLYAAHNPGTNDNVIGTDDVSFGLLGEGLRVGSKTAPVVRLDWEGFFTSRITYYKLDGSGPFTQTVSLQVFQLSNGDLYVTEDETTGTAAYAPGYTGPYNGSLSNKSIKEIELLRFHPNGTLIGSSASVGDDGMLVDYQTINGAQLVPCFVRGTMIATPRGEIAVEDLRVGDLVDTVDGGAQPIVWIGGRTLDKAALDRAPHLRPVRIAKAALGNGTPTADLYVSPQHRVLLQSRIARNRFAAEEVLVAAKQLCQIEGVDIQSDAAQVEYFHLLFDRHQIIVSNGARTESFYPGKMAIQSIDSAARSELQEIFPALMDEDFLPEPARPMLTGRQGRDLARLHHSKNRPLVS